MGNTQVLRLPAGHTAVQLRVAEQRSAASLLTHLGGLALGLQSTITHEALSTRDLERDDHAVHIGVPAVSEDKRVSAGKRSEQQNIPQHEITRDGYAGVSATSKKG